MGKAAMCIRMLQILNTGRVYKISELADLLETNPRNIVEYKKELDEIVSDAFGCAGFAIEAIPGRYGGYKLNGNVSLPALRLFMEEKEALLDSYNYVLSKKDFVRKKELISAMSKVLSNIEVPEKDNKYIVADKYQLSMSEADIQERYKFIEKAIDRKRSVELVYNSLKNGRVVHVVDPYKLFIYNNSWFFLAWNQEAGEVWYYKVNRIESYKMLDNKFTVYKYFKVEDYIDDQGLKKNGAYHHVVFLAKRRRAMLVKERIYGRNQVVTELEDGTSRVELDMQNDEAIVSFILQAGDEIKILEPEWLIDKVKEEAQKIINLYEER